LKLKFGGHAFLKSSHLLAEGFSKNNKVVCLSKWPKTDVDGYLGMLEIISNSILYILKFLLSILKS
jgi:hypothetical protein